jgi:SAM-dependent methyltransferase
VDCLRDEYGLTSEAVVADIGSGTGILSELFLRNGNLVYAVEPNDEMRLAAEQLLAGYPNFYSVNGRAEATTLPERSADFVTAGQAFHWFEPEPTRAEFGRILRPSGWVVLVWNTRVVSSDGLMAGYEALLDRFALAYHDVSHTEAEQHQEIIHFFRGEMKRHTFANEQQFDQEGLLGRMLSSSYAPTPDHPHYPPLRAGLQQLFEQYQVNGRVSFPYETELFIGRLQTTDG